MKSDVVTDLGRQVSDKAFFLSLLGLLAALQNGVRTSVIPFTTADDTPMMSAVQTTSLCVDPVAAYLAYCMV